MSNHPVSELRRERDETGKQDARMMLKLAEFLLQGRLISPEEKFRLTQLIRRGMNL